MGDHRYGTPRWKRLRAQVRRRDQYRCQECGADVSAKGAAFVDHIQEVEDGGAFWDPANLQTLCKPHHDSKSAATRAERSRTPRSPNA
jgi:5-methylcytosine-specific restriction enzyme A